MASVKSKTKVQPLSDQGTWGTAQDHMLSSPIWISQRSNKISSGCKLIYGIWHKRSGNLSQRQTNMGGFLQSDSLFYSLLIVVTSQISLDHIRGGTCWRARSKMLSPHRWCPCRENCERRCSCLTNESWRSKWLYYTTYRCSYCFCRYAKSYRTSQINTSQKRVISKTSRGTMVFDLSVDLDMFYCRLWRFFLWCHVSRWAGSTKTGVCQLI